MSIINKFEKALKTVKSLKINEEEIVSLKSSTIHDFIELHLSIEEFLRIKSEGYEFKEKKIGDYIKVYFYIDSTQIFSVTKEEE